MDLMDLVEGCSFTFYIIVDSRPVGALAGCDQLTDEHNDTAGFQVPIRP